MCEFTSLVGALVSGWKSATRTKARVAWNVVSCCSNRASICSLALILLSQARWIVMIGWCTSICLQPFFSNTFGLWSLVCVHASVNSPLFQTRLIMVACLFTSISLEPKWLRLTWIIPCKCLVFRVVGMVMGTSTVA